MDIVHFYLIAPRIPPGRVDGLWPGWQFDCLNVALDGCRGGCGMRFERSGKGPETRFGSLDM